MLLPCPVYEYANHSILWYISKMHCLLTKAPTLHVVCCTVWLWCVCTNIHRDQTETSPFPVRLQINEAFKWRSESSSASLGHTVSLLQVHDVCVLNPCGSMLLLHEIQLSLMHEQTAALWKYTGSIRLSPVSFHLHAVFSFDRLELFLQLSGASSCQSRLFTVSNTYPVYNWTGAITFVLHFHIHMFNEISECGNISLLNEGDYNEFRLTLILHLKENHFHF